MNARWTSLFVWLLGFATASAQLTDAVNWDAERIRYEFPGKAAYHAWIIKPADEGATGASTFEATIDRIYRTDQNPTIKHICLGDTHRRGPLQDEVIRQLAGTVVIRQYPARRDSDGRMYLDGTPDKVSKTMCGIVYAAILSTSVVKDMNRVLNKHGLQIERVSTEKLFITADKGKFRWDAIGWLIIGRAEQRPSPPPPARQPEPPEGAR